MSRLPRRFVPCQCNGRSPYARGVWAPWEYRACPRYKCKRCKRKVPYCSGGSDSPVCDDCWCQLTKGGKRDVPTKWSSQPQAPGDGNG